MSPRVGPSVGEAAEVLHRGFQALLLGVEMFTANALLLAGFGRFHCRSSCGSRLCSTTTEYLRQTPVALSSLQRLVVVLYVHISLLQQP